MGCFQEECVRCRVMRAARDEALLMARQGVKADAICIRRKDTYALTIHAVERWQTLDGARARSRQHRAAAIIVIIVVHQRWCRCSLLLKERLSVAQTRP